MKTNAARTSVRFRRGWLALLPACVLFAVPAAAADSQAQALWKDFLSVYREYSLEQRGDAELDELARQHLIASLGARYASWKKGDHEDLFALAAAVTKREPDRRPFHLVEQALAALLPAIDRYGGYESAADMARFEEIVRQGSRGSIQMTIEADAGGRLLCFPHADGPAATAGVLPGAELLEVDGLSVAGKELVTVKFAFIGPSSSEVRMQVRQPHGKVEDFTVARAAEPPLIAVSDGPLGLDVRIRRFDRGSARALRDEFRKYSGTAKRLTLDLRGNPGGLREEAYLAASLFFPKGEVIGRFTTRAGTEEVTDGNEVEISPSSIRILIDGRTASGAEYLAAALREGLPAKVRIFGDTSYGKGHSTVKIRLEGGGSVTLTEAGLETGTGFKWEKAGVKPDHLLEH